ncbi:MAG TPA: hypothetical protein VHX16_01220 [Chloroflexota bacterium]|jgi:hypothetical protein|nr:hypothetical protein [Chloroflexota bacterium]
MTELFGLYEAYLDESDDDQRGNGEETAEEGVDIPDDAEPEA